MIIEHLQSQEGYEKTLIANRDKQLKFLSQRKDRLLQGYLDGLIEKAEYESERNKLQVDVSKLSTEIPRVNVDIEVFAREAEEYLTTLPDRWEQGTPPEKKMLLGSIFPKGIVFDGESHRTKLLPLVIKLSNTPYRTKLKMGELNVPQIEPIIEELKTFSQAISRNCTI